MVDRSTALTAEHLAEALADSDRFHRDTSVGAIYHRGKVSFREKTPIDSLHVIVEGNRMSAHIDRISPLKHRPDGTVRYSLGRVLAHNLAGMGGDLGRLVGRRRGQQRCRLECVIEWVDDEPTPEPEAA
ncbi:MAG: hypothetical protein ACR2HY_09945 [Acidimicrobiales bacterium]